MKSKRPTKTKEAAPSAPLPIGNRVVASLHAAADIFEERNKVYGDNFLHFGKTMAGIFPRGLKLETEEEFNRFCIFVQVVSKATRYGQSFKRGGHQDSLDDISVYSQMLAEIDKMRQA